MLKRIIAAWRMLDRSIYTGDRLKQNLTALTAAGILSGLLGLFLVAVNLRIGQTGMLIGAAITVIFGFGCAYCAGVLKNRKIAILFPTFFCAVIFTIYTLTGAGDGSAVLWTFVMPIGMCYFVSVKYGIMLSVYFSALFVFLFYTPLRERMAQFYSDAYLVRFPVMYFGSAALTAMAMVQYHRSVLLENEYAERLNAEVELQTEVARRRADLLAQLSEEMVQTLAVTIDAKDRYTNGHSFRVSRYSAALAEKLGWQAEQVDRLRREALLHDIGKIGVPDQVLNKPDKLTDEEFSVIKSHTTIGGNILNRSETLREAAKVARYHHERYDGRGYPERLAGEDIPYKARIVAISDAYDAMNSDRIYRKGLPRDVIRNELVRGRGTQFDPSLLDSFLELFDNGTLQMVEKKEEQERVLRPNIYSA